MATPSAGTASPKAAASSAPAAKRVIGPKLGIARIRCADPLCKHGETVDGVKVPNPAWFRAMFVLIANATVVKEQEKPPEGQADGGGGSAPGAGGSKAEEKDPPPVFTLWRTDENGYLSPLKTQEEKDKEAEKQKRIADAAAKQAELRKQQKKDYDKAVLDYRKKKAAYDQAVKARPALEAAYEKKMAAWEAKKALNESKGLPPPPQPAPLPPLPEDPGEAPQPPEPAVVEPDLSGLDSPYDSIKLADGEKYLLHLALCADEATARDYLKSANDGTLKGKNDQPPKPLDLMLTPEVTGQALEKGQRTKSDVQESVFVVNKTPEYLTGEGGDIYDNMVLFYTEIVREEKLKKGKIKRVFLYSGMPNGECPRVAKQVEKLQVHLGAMRFPLGTNGMPYVGSVVTPFCSFRNRGIFDALTFGAVVAFQKCASAGKCFQIDSAIYKEIINVDGDFGITANAYSAEFARKQSPAFLTGSDGSAATSLPANGVVDKKTADAIKDWLKNGRRKPGAVLAALHPNGNGGNENGEWMRQEAREKYFLWKKAVTDLGWDHTMVAGHVFRDTRTAVVEAPPGMATRSIHKAGMAADMSMVNYGPTHPEFPVSFIWDLDVKGKPKPGTDPLLNTEPDVRWRLFGEIGKAAWDAGKDRFLAKARELGLTESIYRTEIRPWTYDAKNFGGGQPLDLKKTTGRFIDLTAIGAVFGFEPISTAGQWAFHLAKVGELTTVQSVLAVLAALRKMSSTAPLVIKRPNMSYGEMVFLNDIDLDLLDKWMARFYHEVFLAEPLPDVNISGLSSDQKSQQILSILETDFPDDPLILSDDNHPDLFVTGREVRTWVGMWGSRIRPDSGPYSMAKGDAIYSGADGVARCQEWWHFQYQALISPASGRKKWSELLEEIGYSKEGLLKLGYPPSDMDEKAS